MEVEAAQLKAFFLWMVENAERSAPQAGTLKQYFRVLKMIYKRETGAMLDEELVADVNAVSDNLDFGKTPLTKTDSLFSTTPKAKRRPRIAQNPCRRVQTS